VVLGVQHQSLLVNAPVEVNSQLRDPSKGTVITYQDLSYAIAVPDSQAT